MRYLLLLVIMLNLVPASASEQDMAVSIKSGQRALLAFDSIATVIEQDAVADEEQDAPDGITTSVTPIGETYNTELCVQHIAVETQRVYSSDTIRGPPSKNTFLI